jgi:hypothetical protein
LLILGTLGLFLGMSVLSFIEILEIVFECALAIREKSKVESTKDLKFSDSNKKDEI